MRTLVDCRLPIAPLLLVAVFVCGCGSPGPASPPAPQEVLVPNPDVGADTLQARKRAQLAAADQFKVFYQFQFADRIKDSGITFEHHIVEDAGKHYKAVHYDHGNGIAVADVDGDGLYDIYFVNQVGGNQLWKNLGGGRFRNITTEAGVGLPDRISVAASFADTDNDGDQDLFVTTVRGGNVLFENDGHGHFKDVSKAAGVDLVTHSSGAVFFDFDRDGLVDLLVCNVGQYTADKKGPDGAYVGLADAFLGHTHPDRFEYPVLYKNTGHNQFKDVTAELGLRPAGWGGDASVADLNGDGWPDLFVLNMQGHGHYFENQGGHAFIDKTAEFFPRTPWGAMGIKFFDFDNDGRPDLFITDMHSDMFEALPPEREKQKAAVHPDDVLLGGSASTFIFGNALFHNISKPGGTAFEEVSDRAGRRELLAVGSERRRRERGWLGRHLHRVEHGLSAPVRHQLDVVEQRRQQIPRCRVPARHRAAPGWPDAHAVVRPRLPAGRHGHRSLPGRSGTIRVMAPLGSRSAAIFDLDGDGDLDIVTSDFNSAPQILVSDLSQRRAIHWLQVALVGTSSNRDGLGATVRVHAGEHVYTKYHDGKSGYLSQSALPLYFGLGDADKVDSVEVTWPSGRKQVVTQGLEINRTLRVTEPK